MVEIVKNLSRSISAAVDAIPKGTRWTGVVHARATGREGVDCASDNRHPLKQRKEQLRQHRIIVKCVFEEFRRQNKEKIHSS